MAKWIDRMMNWGFLAIPLLIALVVFLLGRLGCGAVPNNGVEIREEKPPVSKALENTNEQTLLLRQP